jgi:hypothetical protein
LANGKGKPKGKGEQMTTLASRSAKTLFSFPSEKIQQSLSFPDLAPQRKRGIKPHEIIQPDRRLSFKIRPRVPEWSIIVESSG